MDNEAVFVYPNPTDNEITVTWKNKHSQRLNIIIYDLLGRVVRELQNDPDVNEIKMNLDRTSLRIYLFEMKDTKNNVILNR